MPDVSSPHISSLSQAARDGDLDTYMAIVDGIIASARQTRQSATVMAAEASATADRARVRAGARNGPLSSRQRAFAHAGHVTASTSSVDIAVP